MILPLTRHHYCLASMPIQACCVPSQLPHPPPCAGPLFEYLNTISEADLLAAAGYNMIPLAGDAEVASGELSPDMAALLPTRRRLTWSISNFFDSDETAVAGGMATGAIFGLASGFIGDYVGAAATVTFIALASTVALPATIGVIGGAVLGAAVAIGAQKVIDDSVSALYNSLEEDATMEEAFEAGQEIGGLSLALAPVAKIPAAIKSWREATAGRVVSTVSHFFIKRLKQFLNQ